MRIRKFSFLLLGSLCVGLLAAKECLETVVNAAATRAPALKPLEASYHGRSLKKYNPGFDNMLGGLLWVQLLQKASHTPLTDDQVSWEYAQLDAITTLDPHFQRSYEFGHAFLSVFRRDKLGAKLILGKWMKQRPTYWKALYLYAYHLFFELHDYAEAAPILIRAAQMEGAPPWLSALGIRLLEQEFAYEQALRQSVELYQAINSDEARQRLLLRIRSIRFGQQKRDWESALTEYRNSRRREPTSLSDLATLRKANTRQLSSLLDLNISEDLVEALQETHRFAYDPAKKAIVAENKAIADLLDKMGIYVPPAEKKSQEGKKP